MIDFTKLKKMTVGGIELKKLLINGIEVWRGFTNQVPISTDTDGSIYNGVGYIENRRLSSSGGLSSYAQNGSVTTGFIPFGGGSDVIELKGVEWLNAFTKYSGHYYIVFYNASKSKLDYFSSETYSGGTMNHIITITRDANGVETVAFNQSHGDTSTLLNNIRKAKFIRITARGKGADMIVTINEEIE